MQSQSQNQTLSDTDSPKPNTIEQFDEPSIKSEKANVSLSESITKLSSGKAFAIGVGLLTTPLIARLYGPQSFGIVAILIAIVSTLKPAVCFAYENALPLSSSPEERRSLFILSAGIAGATTFLLAFFSILCDFLLAPTLTERGLSGYLFFIPILFVATALTSIGNMCLSCERRFGQVAIRDVLDSVGTRFSRIGLAFTALGNTPLGLLFGTLTGMFTSALVFPVSIVKDILQHPENRLRWSEITEVARKHSKFPKYHMTSLIFNSLSTNLPVYILGAFFPFAVAGTFSVVHRLLQLPRDLFANAAGKAFYIDTAEQNARGESIAESSRQMISIVLALTSLPFTAIVMLAPFIFDMLLGSSWKHAGLYAQILTPVLAASTLSSPLSSLFLTKGDQARGLSFNILLTVSRLSALLIGTMAGGPELTLVLYAISSVGVYILVINRTLRLAQVSRKWMTLRVVRSYGESFLWILPTAIVHWRFDITFLTLAVTAVSISGYIILTFKRHPELAAR